MTTGACWDCGVNANIRGCSACSSVLPQLSDVCISNSGGKMRTIKWECTKSPGWDWRGADDKAVPGLENEQTGTITLEPNDQYWFQCGYLFVGSTVGKAAIRYYRDNKGRDTIQVFTDARGEWHVDGAPGHQSSSTGPTSGGISLTAFFIS